MSELTTQARDFLNQIFQGAALDLRAEVTSADRSLNLDIEGDDAHLLRSEGGELLEALEHLVNQVYGRQLAKGERFVCDVEGYRATREVELRAMARHAADRVRDTGVPFTFGPMSPNERRIIHLALVDDPDLQTESVGEGHERRLKVSKR